MSFALAIVTCLATITLAVYAIVQARILTRQLRGSFLLRVFDMMEETRPYRVVLHKAGPYGRWKDMLADESEEERDAADRVATCLQRVAFLCRRRLVDRRIVMEGWATTFSAFWDLLAEYVADWRVHCREAPSLEEGGMQRGDFELFAKECRQLLSTGHRPSLLDIARSFLQPTCATCIHNRARRQHTKGSVLR